jgi:SAM-dependent methyltransferase
VQLPGNSRPNARGDSCNNQEETTSTRQIGYRRMNARVMSEGADGLAEARARLAESLRAGGRAGAVVSKAFLTVPRHVFLPQELATEAYEDKAIAIKSDADGLPVSASSQPAMMAIMLEQLGLAAGHRVLEIGAGTGYNAALIAEIVGRSGSVVTIDTEPDLVDQARASLAADVRQAGRAAIARRRWAGETRKHEGLIFMGATVTAQETTCRYPGYYAWPPDFYEHPS